jgi:hypothetical protein
MNHNNWRIFHDRLSNRMVFIPHGLDQMFGVERADPDCPILPHLQGLVARAVLQTPEGRRRYFERVSELYTNTFRVQAILQRVDSLAEVIRPVLADSGPQEVRSFDQEVRWLKRRITQRDESLAIQLQGLATPLEFDTNGIMALSGWRRVQHMGEADLRHEKTREGKSLLSIGPVRGDTKASWRTKVLLDGGIYRLEGRVRTQDVRSGEGEAAGGAAFRISGASARQGVFGTTDWRRFAYTFQVPPSGLEVELVCELRARAGQVWFDADTLRLVRVHQDTANSSR